MTSKFDKLISSDPIDQLTARVISKGTPPVGDRIDSTQMRWAAPPECKPYLGPDEHNLTGRRFGQLTVYGCFGKSRSATGMRWVVKCVCGYYEVRRTAYLKKESTGGRTMCCTQCDYVEELRSGRINNTIRAEKRREKGYE